MDFGQANDHASALARRRFRANNSTRSLDDASHGCKAGATARCLGREEWIERPRGGLAIHTQAGVADNELEDATGGARAFGFTKAGLKAQDSASRHSIARIEGKVHDDLLRLSGGNSH